MQRVALDRGRVALYAAGRRSSPPVLLLHGGGMSGRAWHRVVGLLEGEFRCLAPDLPGHGESDWAPDGDYTLAALARDVAALVGHLGIERAPVVGHSLGGLAAAWRASHDGGTSALVLVDVSILDAPQGGAEIRRFMRATAGPFELETVVREACRMNPRRDPERVRRAVRRSARPTGDGRWTWRYDPRLVRPARYAAMKGEMETLGRRLDDLSCPTLIVQGADSRVLSRRQATEMAAVLPRAHWVSVAGAGHSVHGDNPSGFVEAVRPFLLEHVEAA